MQDIMSASFYRHMAIVCSIMLETGNNFAVEWHRINTRYAALCNISTVLTAYQVHFFTLQTYFENNCAASWRVPHRLAAWFISKEYAPLLIILFLSQYFKLQWKPQVTLIFNLQRTRFFSALCSLCVFVCSPARA